MFGYKGKVVRQASKDTDYLVDNPVPALSYHRQGPRPPGLQPAVTLEEGLRRSLLWYTENRVGGGLLMRVSIIGMGYVGLVTGVCLAEKGHRSICVDVDQKKVECIQRRASRHFETRPRSMVLEETSVGRLQATTEPCRCVSRKPT